MGDQLAKGWADKKARPQMGRDGEHYEPLPVSYAVWGAPSLKPSEAEIEAEEAMLP